MLPAVSRVVALQEYLFRNIQRSEWEPLFNFINARKIKIENLAEARHGPRGPGTGIDLGDDLDAGLRAARAEAGVGAQGVHSCTNQGWVPALRRYSLRTSSPLAGPFWGPFLLSS